MFDRFDICEAWYLFLTERHEGQCSKKYKRLSKLLGYFDPKPNLSFATLSDNAKHIYVALLG